MTMDNQDTINKEREIADDKMITAAFDKLMKTYLDSPHRKRWISSPKLSTSPAKHTKV